MSYTTEGPGDYKPALKLEGNKVIVEKINVFDGFVNLSYIREVIYHFKDEELAKEYYYKNK